MEPEGADDYAGPLPPMEDYLNPSMCTVPAKLPFKLRKIRPAPYSGENEPIERLKSFGSGVIKKKKKKRRD